jgi:isoquinoline 1-oxidoreductase beta subunit
MTKHDINLSRRGFVKGAGGLTFAVALSGPLMDATYALAQEAGKINAYVTIGKDGVVTITSPAIEMGQAVNTALPLIIAEELDADWSKVKIAQAPINPVYNHPVLQSQFIVASLSVRGYWIPVRTAAAQARRVLLDAVAERWNVPVAELTTEPGTVVHAASNRKISYGEVAAFARVPEKMPDIKPENLKPAAQFRLIGKDVPRIDVPAKVSGKQDYAIDVQVPNLHYGTLARAPVRGSGPVSFNHEEIKAQPGIVDVVALNHGIGITGTSIEAVFAARAKLKAQWRDAPGSKVDSEKNLQEYLAHVRDPNMKGVVGRNTGDANAAIAGAAKVHANDYSTDYVYHAQMEPHSATASVTRDGVEVWTGTQWLTKARDEAAKAAGVPPEKVTLHQMQMGGSYGRNAFVEYVIDAVLLSKSAGRPVKMIQSREDDVLVGRFRPMTAQRIEVGMDGEGKVTGWRHRVAADTVVPYVYGQARMDAQKGVDHIVIWGADMPHYNVPNHMAEHIYEERGVRTAAWRGIGAGPNNFAIESMIDELAALAGKNPLEYRLALLKDDRAKRVVERAAQMAEWSRKREGRALGIAFAKLGAPPVGFSVTGTVAEVSVDRASGAIKVHNLWCVADVGLPVQPGNVAAQVEGSLIYSLGSALKERVTLKNGMVQQTNFNNYEILRMSEVPQIHVEVLRSGDIPLPVGELGIPGTIPAVANAVFTLTGKRLRNAPFTPDRVKQALS